MIKKLVLLALAVIVAVVLVKYIPQWIGKARQEQSEKVMKLEDHAQKRAKGMVGNGPSKVDTAVGGIYGKKALETANKAYQRSAKRIEEMERNEE